MGRSLIILLLPILLSLSLLVDATRNDLLPLNIQENNEEDDSLILQDVFQQNAFLLLPSEKENEMMMDVPELVGTPRDENQVPTETPNRLSLLPRVREGKSDYVFHPREGDSILRPRKGGIDFNFNRGRRGWRFRHTGAGCHHHRHHHGGEMKFRYFRGDGSISAPNSHAPISSPLLKILEKRPFLRLSEASLRNPGSNRERGHSNVLVKFLCFQKGSKPMPMAAMTSGRGSSGTEKNTNTRDMQIRRHHGWFG